MAFSADTFSKLLSFRPRAFIKAVGAEFVNEGTPGNYGNRTLGMDTFSATSFAARSLHGLFRSRRKRRMTSVSGKFDARGGVSRWT